MAHSYPTRSSRKTQLDEIRIQARKDLVVVEAVLSTVKIRPVPEGLLEGRAIRAPRLACRNTRYRDIQCRCGGACGSHTETLARSRVVHPWCLRRGDHGSLRNIRLCHGLFSRLSLIRKKKNEKKKIIIAPFSCRWRKSKIRMDQQMDRSPVSRTRLPG